MNFRCGIAAFALIIATAFIVPVVCAQEVSHVVKADDFVRQASIGNQFEFISSRLAVQQATGQDVKSFAKMVIADHAKIADALKNTLISAKINVAPVHELDQKHQKMLNILKSASIESFDEAYIESQVDSHDEAVALFKNYAERGDNADLVAFASDTLPILERHQAKIKDLRQPLISVKP